MFNFEEKLEQLGLALPAVKVKKGSVIEKGKIVGNLLFVSGQAPKDVAGKLVYGGKIDKDVSIEGGYQAAKLCILNCLAVVKKMSGSLNNIAEIVRVRGFVNSIPNFTRQSDVLDGASELLLEVFGDHGKHVRTTIGVVALPGDMSVEVDMVVRLRDEE